MDLWALWPDDYMCPVEELEQNLQWRSDDFHLVEVLEYDESSTPLEWRKYGHYENFSNDVVYVHQPITPWGGDD